MTFRVLVVGGAGVFGARLVTAVLASTDWEVVVAGRDLRRAEAFAGPLGGRVSAVALDGGRCTAGEVASTGAGVVVDVAGPFQGAGYGLATAAIGAGVHFVDIADGRDFVAGFGPALDGLARAAGVVALTGASSTPALSNAALDAITVGWGRVDAVTIAISPGNRAPRGRSVVTAILSYAGRGVRVWVDGAWATRAGWGGTRRLLMPGIGRRWLSLCETPDLDVVPGRVRGVGSVVFLAGLELGVLHLGLAALAFVVRSRLVRSLEPMAGVARRMAALFGPFGSDRGGMLVEAVGQDEAGRRVRACWSLVAEGGDGPTIPILPALAVMRAIAGGRVPAAGARICVDVVSLEAIEAEMSRYRISTRSAFEVIGAAVFARALGGRFGSLPGAVRALHGGGWWTRYAGVAEVSGPDGFLARVVARVVGFPRPARAVPVSVMIAVNGPEEVWTRDFGGRVFRSRLSFVGVSGEVEERFGPFAFRLALAADAEGLRLRVVGGRIGPVRLPRWVLPSSDAAESVDGMGRFRFDVPIDLPLGLGRVVRYTGWLVAR